MSKTVLIVDDSPTELKLMRNAIEGKGYTLLTASNGVEALKIATGNHPDLILLDVVMPGKDGFKVCRELKRAPETQDIKIIMVTTKNQETDKFWGQKQGADGYITKPFTPENLASTVERMI